MMDEKDIFKENLIRKGMEVWNRLPYEDKLYLMCWISNLLREHLHSPTTYRGLIYDKLGFSFDAYVLLQFAGLLEVHNALVEQHSWMKKEEEEKP